MHWGRSEGSEYAGIRVYRGSEGKGNVRCDCAPIRADLRFKEAGNGVDLRSEGACIEADIYLNIFCGCFLKQHTIIHCTTQNGTTVH